ncbi:MAG: hypothetical protein WCD49_04295 [Candidatus Acidiferrales bacterium]
MGPIHDHEEMTPEEMLRKSISFLQAIEKQFGLTISPSVPAKPAVKNVPQGELPTSPQETAGDPPTRKARPRAQDPENSRLAHILNRKRRDTY